MHGLRMVAAALALGAVAQSATAAVLAKLNYPQLSDTAAKFADEPLALSFAISPSGDAVAYIFR